jgi:hypothetical protein
MSGNNSERELSEKTQKLLAMINDLGMNALPYVKDSLFVKGAVTMCMQTPEGYRVLVEKAGPDFTPQEGAFFQGLEVSVHPGSAIGANFRQIDYNFNQMDDNQFRKRVLQDPTFSMDRLPTIQTPDDVVFASMIHLAGAEEVIADSKMKEEMGITNQPATLGELRELEAILQDSVLLDPYNNYLPVEE